MVSFGLVKLTALVLDNSKLFGILVFFFLVLII